MFLKLYGKLKNPHADYKEYLPSVVVWSMRSTKGRGEGGRGVKGGTLHRNLSPIRPHKVGKHIGSLMDCHVSWHDHTKQICFKITSKNIMAKVKNFQEKQTLTCITHLFIAIYI